jgi:hypothetical protein
MGDYNDDLIRQALLEQYNGTRSLHGNLPGGLLGEYEFNIPALAAFQRTGGGRTAGVTPHNQGPVGDRPALTLTGALNVCPHTWGKTTYIKLQLCIKAVYGYDSCLQYSMWV